VKKSTIAAIFLAILTLATVASATVCDPGSCGKTCNPPCCAK
jgi:hypothetical protein